MSQASGGRQDRALHIRWESVPQPVRVLVYLLIVLTAVEVYHQANFIFERVFNVLVLFVFAALIALLLTPVVDRLQATAFIRGRRALAVLVANLALLVVLAAGVALLVPLVGQQVKEIQSQGPDLYSRAIAFLNNFQAEFARLGISFDLRSVGTAQIGGELVGNVFHALQATLGLLVNILLVAVISVYLEAQGRELVTWVRRLFAGHQEQVDFFFVATGTTVAGYVRGQLLLALLMGVYTGVAFSLAGVHYAFVIATVVFFLEFIPLIGAPVGMALGVVVAAFQSWELALVAAAIGVGGHAIEAYIVGPRIAGHSTRLHPLAAMAALLIGADLGGLLGALFAVPLAGIANVYLGAWYRARQGDQEAFALPTGRETTVADLPRLGEQITEAGQQKPAAGSVPGEGGDPGPRTRRPSSPRGAPTKPA